MNSKQRKQKGRVGAYVTTAPVIFINCRCMYIGLTYIRACMCARTTLTGCSDLVRGKKIFCAVF